MDVKDFLELTATQIQTYAPATAVYSVGGTRRHALFTGISPTDPDYVYWTQRGFWRCAECIFRHGVQHILTIALTPANFRENKEYQERVMQFAAAGIANQAAIEVYRQNQWQVHLTGGYGIPHFDKARDHLQGGEGEKHLWFMVVQDDDEPFMWMLDAIRRTQAQTRQEVIQTMFGADIPPVELFIVSGKPVISDTLLPPVLLGPKVDCYFQQKPGHVLTEHELRLILYDRAFTRNTWVNDKTGRTTNALDDRHIWEKAPLLGIGTRLGDYWYPASPETVIE